MQVTSCEHTFSFHFGKFFPFNTPSNCGGQSKEAIWMASEDWLELTWRSLERHFPSWPLLAHPCEPLRRAHPAVSAHST